MSQLAVVCTQVYVGEESWLFFYRRSLEDRLLPCSGLEFNGGKGATHLFALISDMQNLSFKMKYDEV